MSTTTTDAPAEVKAPKRPRATCPNTITSSTGKTRRCSRALVGGLCPSCEAGTVTRCTVVVSYGTRADGHSTCGRPVKADGLCGVHLKATTRQASKREAKAAHDATSEENRVAAEALCKTLRGKGVHAFPAYSCTNGSYTGGIELTAEAAQALATGKRPAAKPRKRATAKRA